MPDNDASRTELVVILVLQVDGEAAAAASGQQQQELDPAPCLLTCTRLLQYAVHVSILNMLVTIV
jgi:TctA family transporter